MSGREEAGTVEGNLRVDGALVLFGTVTGSATVVAGGSLRLSGTVLGDLVVEAGGEAVLGESVRGDAVNRGGLLEVYGAVYGALHREAGTTLVDPDAFVRHRH